MIPTLLVVVTVMAGAPTPGREIDANRSMSMTKVMADRTSCEMAAEVMRARSQTAARVFAYCEDVPE